MGYLLASNLIIDLYSYRNRAPKSSSILEFDANLVLWPFAAEPPGGALWVKVVQYALPATEPGPRRHFA